METRIADYLDFLGDLGAANAPYFLEGGQAVNFWAEYFSNKGAGESIERFRPFTSKDCDLWVSYAAFRHIESTTRGEEPPLPMARSASLRLRESAGSGST